MTEWAIPIVGQFWSLVEIGEPSDCWIWQGSQGRQGRGRFCFGGKSRSATHLALELNGKPRMNNLHALHSCDNPQCVNPARLRWGTNRENCADCVSRGRHFEANRTHCPQGHPYSGSNLMIRRGERECKACKNARQNRLRRSKRNAD